MIVDVEGIVLDGVHRTRIAAELGIDVPVSQMGQMSAERKMHLAVGLNMRRRHLDADRHRELVHKLANEQHLTVRKIASITGWSKSTVDRDLRPPSPKPPNLTPRPACRAMAGRRTRPMGEDRRRPARRGRTEAGRAEREPLESAAAAENVVEVVGLIAGIDAQNREWRRLGAWLLAEAETEDSHEDSELMRRIAVLLIRYGSLDPWEPDYDDVDKQLREALDDATAVPDGTAPDD